MTTRSTNGWRWTILAALAGFAVSFLFADVMELGRGGFVAVYSLVVIMLTVAFNSSLRMSIRTQLRRHWKAGVIGGVLVGMLLAWQVMSQPSSAAHSGTELLSDVAWYGIVYGIIDALLLSVIPVIALYGTRHEAELKHQNARLKWGAIALAGSILVTATYHAGFSEYRSSALIQPIIGNTVMTLAFLLTGSPLAPVVAHVMMHVAAVLHGMETTAQLPPHH